MEFKDLPEWGQQLAAESLKALLAAEHHVKKLHYLLLMVSGRRLLSFFLINPTSWISKNQQKLSRSALPTT